MTNEEDKLPFETSVFVVLLVATFFIPLVGLVMGGMNVKSPNRNGQSCMLLALGLVMGFIYMCSALGGAL